MDWMLRMEWTNNENRLDPRRLNMNVLMLFLFNQCIFIVNSFVIILKNTGTTRLYRTVLILKLNTNRTIIVILILTIILKSLS